MKILPSFLVTAFLIGTATLASAKPVRVADDTKTPRDHAAERFERMDANNDGSISRAEFMASFKDRQAHRKDKAADAKDAKGKNAKHPKKAKRARRAAKIAKSKSV